MLQRAAGNAYSWWWASHIRTKQSKWLDQSLQDMEEKVKGTLKIIDHDGDSFAKRAEMYYRRRPELINFVEESYKAYRALAERYDHLSRELQSANRKIATVFPDEVHFDDDDYEEDSPGPEDKMARDILEAKNSGIPQVPKPPARKFQGVFAKGQPKQMDDKASAAVPSSGLSKSEALEEIDMLQKEILALQTEKEFVKSSYERGHARFWEIENQITSMQGRVCNLQDEFGIGTFIEDSEARKLMAATALKSCKEALSRLKDEEKNSVDEVRMQDGNIDNTSGRIRLLKRELLHQDDEAMGSEVKTDKSIDPGNGASKQNGNHLGSFDGNTEATLSVSELVEKIDELVNKVVSLETQVSSQSALVKKLRSETETLNAQVQALEEEKETLVEDTVNANKKVKELEKGLNKLRQTKQCFHERDRSIVSQFNEASSNLERLSEKLQDVKLDAEVEDSGLFQESKKSKAQAEDPQEDRGTVKLTKEETLFVSGPNSEMDVLSEKGDTSDLYGSVDANSDRDYHEKSMGGLDGEDQPNWRQLFLEGMEDREKILFEEYTTILRSYKDVKNKLSDVEKTNREGLFEMAMQIKQLRDDNATKDQEIATLRQKLDSSLDAGVATIHHDDADQEAREDKPSESPKPPLYKLLLQQNENFIGSLSERETRWNLVSVEETLRTEIDGMLEENLEFWLRFSTSIHMVQKFQKTVHDLQGEVNKLMEKHRQEDPNGEGSHRHHFSRALTSEARPIYKHMREIQTELRMWLEHHSVLKEEQQNRSISLLRIQDDILRLSEPKQGEVAALSEYQAAKFHGEVTNMEQENNKVAYQLQAGLDRVKKLQGEIERSLSSLDERMVGSGFRSGRFLSSGGSSSRQKLPLRSFLFGVKLKKHKQQSSSSSSQPQPQPQAQPQPQSQPQPSDQNAAVPPS
ncbi:hypothetical protein MLD38_024677 [Melastoma candidum]|uniref:Uncharacterized protein n=1 Tax=Melastoma candidum TaxID=119954 RepID=A0ACB9NZT6_9MYRT|nr:hypothetical protein MLD38_024677 [Melastoma candidum]